MLDTYGQWVYNGSTLPGVADFVLNSTGSATSQNNSFVRTPPDQLNPLPGKAVGPLVGRIAFKVVWNG